MIKIPDWANEGQRLVVLAGVEEVAHKGPDGWKVKTVRCDMCGKCCMDVPKGWMKFFEKSRDPATGHCKHLRDMGGGKWDCSLGADRPYSCCVSDGDTDDYCCIRWRDV